MDPITSKTKQLSRGCNPPLLHGTLAGDVKNRVYATDFLNYMIKAAEAGSPYMCSNRKRTDDEHVLKAVLEQFGIHIIVMITSDDLYREMGILTAIRLSLEHSRKSVLQLLHRHETKSECAKGKGSLL